jgi:hypothetical protein
MEWEGDYLCAMISSFNDATAGQVHIYRTRELIVHADVTFPMKAAADDRTLRKKIDTAALAPGPIFGEKEDELDTDLAADPDEPNDGRETKDVHVDTPQLLNARPMAPMMFK